MKDLAVIMSVYYKDRLKFVREAVQSILDQTYRDFDFFISFDGPVASDVEEYLCAVNDERVKIRRIEINGGLAKALNYLLSFVMADPQYKFIARMDADDVSMPERLEEQRDLFLDNPDISCVGTWYEEIDEYGKHLLFRKPPYEHNKLRKRYITRTPFAHSSVMYTKNLIEMVGKYPTDTIFMEDNVLWAKALEAGLKFANVPVYLHKFRIDKGYFKRRSGIKYGKNYIKTKFRINKKLKLPLYSYFFSLIIGFIKMFPAVTSRFIYTLLRARQNP